MLFCLTRRHYKTCSLNPQHLISFHAPYRRRVCCRWLHIAVVRYYREVERFHPRVLLCWLVVIERENDNWHRNRGKGWLRRRRYSRYSRNVMVEHFIKFLFSVQRSFTFPTDVTRRQKRWIPTQNIWNMSTFGALLSALWCHKLTNVSLFHPFLIIKEFITTRRSNNEK